jgi:hypothetical protein
MTRGGRQVEVTTLLCPDCTATGTRTVLHHDGGPPEAQHLPGFIEALIPRGRADIAGVPSVCGVPSPNME